MDGYKVSPCNQMSLNLAQVMGRKRRNSLSLRKLLMRQDSLCIVARSTRSWRDLKIWTLNFLGQKVVVSLIRLNIACVYVDMPRPPCTTSVRKLCCFEAEQTWDVIVIYEIPRWLWRAQLDQKYTVHSSAKCRGSQKDVCMIFI